MLQVLLPHTSLINQVLHFLAEYDALPGLGHACGQYYWNSKRFRGTALKQVIDEIGGKVVVLGCPAEEVEKMVLLKRLMLKQAL